MVSEIISELESIIECLREAQSEDMSDAISSLDNLGSELREQADQVEQAASKLSDAREVLS